jgi:hypothetical protein
MNERILGCYLIITLIIGCFWLLLFWKDTSTPKTHVTSWLIILIAPWFWPIVIPLSIAELSRKLSKLKKMEHQKDNLERLFQSIGD